MLSIILFCIVEIIKNFEIVDVRFIINENIKYYLMFVEFGWIIIY